MPTPTEYDRILELRTDTTQWLLHFTHNARARGGSSSSTVPAREILLKIIVDGALEPSWSIRGGRKTVYGPRPAVCFTEMPLLAFSQYLVARNNDSVISGYGVILHKKQVFADGGRPVIYEPNNIELAKGEDGYVEGLRLVKPSYFPFDQQYRLVTTNLGSAKTLDWTHEREWRWPKQEEPFGDVRLEIFGSGRCSSYGVASGRPHVFVQRNEDIPWLQRQVVESLPPPEEAKNDLRMQHYRRSVRESIGVISLEYVRSMVDSGETRYSRLESWPKEAEVDIVGAPGVKKVAGEIFVHT